MNGTTIGWEKINRREEAELNRQESMNSTTACEWRANMIFCAEGYTLVLGQWKRNSLLISCMTVPPLSLAPTTTRGTRCSGNRRLYRDDFGDLSDRAWME